MNDSSLGAVVLGGGRSTRMGRDKASLPFGDGTMLSRTVDTLARLAREVVVVARRDQVLPSLTSVVVARVVVAFDDVEGKGPVGGLVAGLAASTADVVYASSCDVPFLSAAFVRAVVAALGDTAIAIPETDGRLHPLAAAYRREAVLPIARALLAEDRLRPIFMLERLPHVRVPEAALRAVDPSLESLRNLNTPADYEAALVRFRTLSPLPRTS